MAITHKVKHSFKP